MLLKVSPAMLAVYRVLQKAPDGWKTASDIAEAAEMNERTTRFHLDRLTRTQIVEAFRMSRAHYFRLSRKGMAHNKEMVARLRQAEEVFGQ
jgi:predicted ArsR family transcriptional regulator